MSFNSNKYHKLTSVVPPETIEAEGYCICSTKQDGTEVVICNQSSDSLPPELEAWVISKDQDHETALRWFNELTWYDYTVGLN